MTALCSAAQPKSLEFANQYTVSRMPRSEKFGIWEQKQLKLTAFCRRAAFRRLKSIVFILFRRAAKMFGICQ
jgi:hypothetical protein